MMIELPQYAESLHQPIPSMEELSIHIQAAFQPFIEALQEVAHVLVKALQPAMNTINRWLKSKQVRLFLASMRRRGILPMARKRRVNMKRVRIYQAKMARLERA